MKAAAAALALCACSRHVEEASHVDAREAVALEALRTIQRHEAVASEVRSAPVVVTDRWYAPDGGVTRERVTRRGPVVRETRREAEAQTVEHVTVDAGVEVVAETRKVADTRPSWGLNLWLVLVPAVVLGLVALAWRLRWIP